MSDDPDFHFEVTGAEIEAAVKRGDYAWLVENVFNPALVQFLVHRNTERLKNDPTPRARRPVGIRRNGKRTRRSNQAPG